MTSVIADDLYGRLGVSTTASTEEITAAFRSRAKELHPDRHPGDVVVAERFKELTNAYNVLVRADSRARYDRRRAARSTPSPRIAVHEPIFKTPRAARTAVWAGLALFVMGVAGGVVLGNLDTGDSAKTITLWIVVVKLLVCGAALWILGAWRLARLRAAS